MQLPQSPTPSKEPVFDVSVVIVNYNVRTFLEQALESVMQAGSGLRVEVFVVDNNSSDGSVEMVRENFPEVHLIANKDNPGFGVANNQAIRIAQGRYLLILNPDTIVQENTLQEMVSFMDAHPDAGAAGCKILNPDGTFAPESRRSFPTPAVAFYRISGLSKLFPNSPRFGKYNLSYLSIEEPCEVDALSGSCMFVRTRALYESPKSQTPGAGLFDEDFFMYGEDLDWCYRIQQAGWKIYYTPSTQIIHYKGESTKKGDLRYVMLFYGAMLQFSEKHFKNKHSWFFRTMLRLGIIARGSLQVVTNSLKKYAGLLVDLGATLLVMAAAGIVWFSHQGMDFPTRYLAIIVPAYTLIAIFGISLQTGYRSRQYIRLKPVFLANLVALFSIAALSFFIKDIGFSRASLLSGASVNILIGYLIRLIYTHKKHPANQLRRAIVVGEAEDALQLHQTLQALPNPLLSLAGFITDTPSAAPQQVLPLLGPLRHLKDIVRLQHINEIVFIPGRLTNQDIFNHMQQLKDYPVTFKMLSTNNEHLIGQSSIDALNNPPLIDAELALGRRRSTLQRRAFEGILAFLGILSLPLVVLVALFTGRGSAAGYLSKQIRRLPSVLKGSRALIGYRPEEATFIPETWHLKPGIFTISDSLPLDTKSANDLNRAYWLYFNNQSMALDFDIIIRCIKQRRK